MSACKKPRKAYRPKWGLINPIQLAIEGATKPTLAQREEILKPFRACITALREGVATEQQWSVVSGAVAMCRAVQDIGVMTGITGHLQLADDALNGIHSRAKSSGTWKPPALDFHELDAVQDMHALYVRQVNEMCRSEFDRVLDVATRAVMKQGNMVDVIRSGGQYQDLAEVAA